jgi:hypothetical protein
LALTRLGTATVCLRMLSISFVCSSVIKVIPRKKC